MGKARKFFHPMRVLFLSFTAIAVCNSMVYAAMPAKTISIAFSTNIGVVDPHNTSTNPAVNSTLSVFEGFVDDDREGNFAPLLAERWEANETGDRWRFFLRKGVQFHNGEPFDAKDVKCTFDRLIAGKSRLRNAMSYWKSLVSCEIVDDYTVDLVFDAPNPYCLSSAGATVIIPDEAYAEYGDDLWNKDMMYGTGPWKFEERIEGQYIHLLKNQSYWNKAKYDSYYEEMYLRVVPEPATAAAAHLAGDVQVGAPNGGIDSEFRPMYEAAKNRIQKIERKTSTQSTLIFQCEEGRIFHDKNARMALEYALDRQAICNDVLDGDAEVVSSIISAPVKGFDPNLPPYEYNPEKAREFLKKSDYDGRKFTVLSHNGIKKVEEILLVMVDNLRAAGFNADLEIIETAPFMERRVVGRFDVCVTQTLFPGNDAAEALSLRFDYPNGDGHHYINAELHELIGKMLREMDAAKRASYVTRISHLTREEAAPATGIGSQNVTYYADWGVKGIRFFRDGGVRIMYVDYDSTLVPKE